jgi:hypothetical protein
MKKIVKIGATVKRTFANFWREYWIEANQDEKITHILVWASFIVSVVSLITACTILRIRLGIGR